MAFSIDQVYFLDEFCKLKKTPSDGNLQEVFVMLVAVVVIFLAGRFYVSGLFFPCHRHSTLASQALEAFIGSEL